MTAYLETESAEASEFYQARRITIGNEPRYIVVYDRYTGDRKATLTTHYDVWRRTEGDFSRTNEELLVRRGGNDFELRERVDGQSGKKYNRIVSLHKGELNEQDIFVNPHNLSTPVRIVWREGSLFLRAANFLGRLLSPR